MRAAAGERMEQLSPSYDLRPAPPPATGGEGKTGREGMSPPSTPPYCRLGAGPVLPNSDSLDHFTHTSDSKVSSIVLPGGGVGHTFPWAAAGKQEDQLPVSWRWQGQGRRAPLPCPHHHTPDKGGGTSYNNLMPSGQTQQCPSCRFNSNVLPR